MRYIRRMVRFYQGFVISAVLLLVGIILLFLVVIPGVGRTRDMYESMRALEKETQALEAKRAFLSELDGNQITQQLAALLVAVPQDKSIQTIVRTVEGLADQTRVIVDDMSLTSPGSLATGSAARQSAAEKKIGASSLSFTLNVSGTYDQIRDFVGKMNAVRRLFAVTSFDLSTSGTGKTQVRLSLTAFYQPLPAKVGSVGFPVTVLSQKEEEVWEKVRTYSDMTQSLDEPLTPVYSSGPRDPFARR